MIGNALAIDLLKALYATLGNKVLNVVLMILTVVYIGMCRALMENPTTYLQNPTTLRRMKMENNERTINVTVYCEPKSKYLNSELPKETVGIIESYCTDECEEMTVTLKEDGTIAYINLLKKGYDRPFTIWGKGLP